jgi:hypothetical protein
VVTAWGAAFAFEAAIAALTSKLAQHIEGTPRYKAGRVRWRKFSFRYLNAYALGLFVAMSVSALANLAHSVEFGGTLAIFTRWDVPFGLYAAAFGGILPLVSLLFARVLSNVREIEQGEDSAVTEAKATIRELRSELKATEQRAQLAEQRFGAIGGLFAEEKQDRIIAAWEQWPDLPNASIAIVAGASRGYVSDVLSENGNE